MSFILIKIRIFNSITDAIFYLTRENPLKFLVKLESNAININCARRVFEKKYYDETFLRKAILPPKFFPLCEC